MLDSPLLVVAIALFFGGLAGTLIRRSFLIALLSTLLSLCGPVLAFTHFAIARSDGAGMAVALLVLLLGGVLAVMGSATLIAVYRRRATVNLDELRELRG